jgi:hypothetical protein
LFRVIRLEQTEVLFQKSRKNIFIYSPMKRSIKTKEEANQYYDIVNKKVDQYISDWKVRPSKLQKYLSSKAKLNSFLKNSEIDDVEGIETVVNDVLDDRFAMEADKVLTFESFNLKQDDLSEGHERAAAEHCRTSLGHVRPKKGYDRIFVVEDMGEKRHLCVLSQSDLDQLRKHVLERAATQLIEEEVDLHTTDIGLDSGKKIRTRLIIPLSRLTDKEALQKVLDENVTKDKMLLIATDYVNDYPITKAGMTFRHAGSKKIDGRAFEIWESKG